MEPVVIEVKDKDGRREVNTYDAESLFNEAKKRIPVGAVLSLYRKVHAAARSVYAIPVCGIGALHRGLCYEESLQHGLAVQDFRLYIDTVETDKDKLDGFSAGALILLRQEITPLRRASTMNCLPEQIWESLIEPKHI